MFEYFDLTPAQKARLSVTIRELLLQNQVKLTINGTAGVASLVDNVLNIPVYSAYSDTQVVSKVLTYDVNDNIDTITITYLNGDVSVKTLAYDVNGNITTITVTGAENYIKTFTYDVNDNITNIDITY